MLNSPKLLNALDYILSLAKSDSQKLKEVLEKETFDVLANLLKNLLPKSGKKKTKSSSKKKLKEDVQDNLKDNVKDIDEVKKKIFEIFKYLFIHSNINMKSSYVKNGIFKLIVMMLKSDDVPAILNSMEYLKNFFASLAHQKIMIKDGVLHQLLKKLKSKDDIIVSRVFDVLLYFEESLMSELVKSGILDLLLEILSNGSIPMKLRSMEVCKNLVSKYQDEIILSGITDVFSDLLRALIENYNEDLFYQILLFIDIFKTEKLSTFDLKIPNYILSINTNNIKHFELGLRIIEKMLFISGSDKVGILDALNIYYNSCDNREKNSLIFQLVLKLSKNDDLLSSIKESGFLEILIKNSIEGKDPKSIKELLDWIISIDISSGKITSIIHPHISKFIEIGKESAAFKESILELSFKLCDITFEHLDKSELIKQMSDIIEDNAYSKSVFLNMIILYERIIKIQSFLSSESKSNLIVSFIDILKHFHFSHEVDVMKRFFKCFFEFENWQSYLSLDTFSQIMRNISIESYHDEIMYMLKIYAKTTNESDGLRFLYIITNIHPSKDDFLTIIKHIPSYETVYTSKSSFRTLKNALEKGTTFNILITQIEYFYYLYELLMDHKEKLYDNGILEVLFALLNKWPYNDFNISLFKLLVNADVCVKKNLITDITTFLLSSTKLSTWIIINILEKIEDISYHFEPIIRNVIKLIELIPEEEKIFLKYLMTLFSPDQTKYKQYYTPDLFFSIVKAFFEAKEVEFIRFGIDLLKSYMESNELDNKTKNLDNLLIQLLFMITSPYIDFKEEIIEVIKLIPSKVFLSVPRFDMIQKIANLDARYFKDIGIFTDKLTIYNFMQISKLIGNRYHYFSFENFLNLSGFSLLASLILENEKFVVSIPTRENDVLGIFYNRNKRNGFLFFKSSSNLSIEHHPIENIDINVEENSISFGKYITVNTWNMEIFTNFNDTNIQNALSNYILDDMHLYSVTYSLKEFNTYKINVSEFSDPAYDGIKSDEIENHDKSSQIRHNGTIAIKGDLLQTISHLNTGISTKYLNQIVSRYLNYHCKMQLDYKWSLESSDSFSGISKYTPQCVLLIEENSIFAACFPSGKLHIGKHEVVDSFIISFKSPSHNEPVIIKQSKYNIPLRITKNELFLGEGTDLYINISDHGKSFSNLGFSMECPKGIKFMTDKAQSFLTGKRTGWKFKQILFCDMIPESTKDEPQNHDFDILSFMVYSLKYLPPKLQDDLISYMHEISNNNIPVRENWDTIIASSNIKDDVLIQKLSSLKKSSYNFQSTLATSNFKRHDFGGVQYIVKLHNISENSYVTNVLVRIRNQNVTSQNEYMMYLYASSKNIQDFDSDNTASQCIIDAYHETVSNYQSRLSEIDIKDESDPIFGDIIKHLYINEEKIKNTVRLIDEEAPIAANIIHFGMNEFVLSAPIHAKTLILYCPTFEDDLRVDIYPIACTVDSKALAPLPCSRSHLIREISPDIEVNTRRCVYARDFDENGVLYYIGTRNSVDWVNPLSNDAVDLKLSHNLFSNNMVKANVIGRNVRENTYWGGSSPQYFILNLKSYKLRVTDYTIRHGYSVNNSFVHNFTLEGSVDGIIWEVIHAKVVSPFSYAFQSHTYHINKVCPYYQYFKFTQKGNYAMTANAQIATGAPYLCIAGFELYGELIEIL